MTRVVGAMTRAGIMTRVVGAMVRARGHGQVMDNGRGTDNGQDKEMVGQAMATDIDQERDGGQGWGIGKAYLWRKESCEWHTVYWNHRKK